MSETSGTNQFPNKLNNEKQKDSATSEFFKKQPRSTNYLVPKRIEIEGEERHKQIRQKHNITVEGENVPPPLETFKDMRLPRPLLTIFRKKVISFPSPIQIQSIPAVLSGRDVVAISSPGSGKSFIYMISTVYFCLERELSKEITRNEGPFVLIICHSSDLVQQAYNLIYNFFFKIWSDVHLDMIKPLLCTQLLDGPGLDAVEKSTEGRHVILATPRRILDSLKQGTISLAQCFMLCLDQADDLLDKYFEEMKTVLSHLKGPTQTLLVSATMTQKIRDIADNFLVKPIVVNVTTPLDISKIEQEVIEVNSRKDKLEKLLDAIKKTDRPVLIFASNNEDVKAICNFLHTHKVGFHSIRSSLALRYRIKELHYFTTYKIGKHGLMVTTDEVSKGLNFPDVIHVINYDMPSDIKVYYERIARTGRWHVEGFATTFIDDSCSLSTKLELKRFLDQTKQDIPDFLMALEPEEPKQLQDIKD